MGEKPFPSGGTEFSEGAIAAWNQRTPAENERLAGCLDAVNPDVRHSEADTTIFREALAARGLEIREKG